VTPDFRDLVDEIDDPDERARLERVHGLLVEAGPPPELSPALASLPDAAPAPDERDLSWLPRRRLGTALVLGFAVLVAAFAAGYLAGGSPAPDESGFDVNRAVALSGAGDSSAVVSVGARDENGNWPMIVTVQGLERLGGGDYYTLALTKEGKPVVTCGTFNVGGGEQATIRMTAAYDLKGYDGWVILHYDAKTHGDTTVLKTARI
jgi:hypothetical protein